MPVDIDVNFIIILILTECFLIPVSFRSAFKFYSTFQPQGRTLEPHFAYCGISIVFSFRSASNTVFSSTSVSVAISGGDVEAARQSYPPH